MTDPLNFISTSPRHSFPLLFAGQAQKELTVNEALCRADALIHCAIEDQLAAPPTSPTEGQCWLIAASPTGDWDGHAGDIACREAGAWLFVTPRDGLRMLNRATGQEMFYRGGWQVPTTPAAPTGGTTVDAQARTAINGLISALKLSGILAPWLPARAAYAKMSGMFKKIYGSSLLAALAACQTPAQNEAETLAQAALQLSDATPAGTARLVDSAGKLTLIVSLRNISPGEHAMHLHTTGSCTVPDFQSAGPHLNPHGKQHGIKNPMGRHLGDLPNVLASPDGSVEVSVTLDGTVEALMPVLFDADGTAIVVHASADDMVTDPAGNAGKRIACGSLRPA
jgi:superoxide dismutase, Cu-Zn family